MIIGNGLIASALSEKEIFQCDILFFASGVSNSLETRIEEFDREVLLLKKVLHDNKDKKIVYFSSCSIYDTETPYSLHKLAMESIIKNDAERYLICRLPQVVGKKSNTSTLVNHFVNSLLLEQEIKVWKNAYRNIIDIEDVIYILTLILKNKKENVVINIASPYSINVIDLIKILETYFNKTMSYTLIDKGTSYNINIEELKETVDFSLLFEKNSEEYILKVLRKYY